MNILSSTLVFSFFTIVSRILGYARDILIAVFLGTSIYADAFFVAFRLPNTFRRLFAEGTFNAAFIPSYSKEKIISKTKAKVFADQVLSILVLILFFLVVIAEIFMPVLVRLIAPGFYNNVEKFELAVTFSRITFPFLFFITLASFYSGILNSNKKFAAAAAAPIFLNILLISSIIFSYKTNADYALNLSYATTFSGLIQLLFLIYVTQKFYRSTFNFINIWNSKLKSFFKKLLPSIFASGVTQINILVGTIIASFQASAVSYLYYADRIYQINLAIAGIAISTVSLPILAKYIAQKKVELVKKAQNRSLELCLILSLPASIGLIISAEEIVSALFGYGSFKMNDVTQTSLALKYFGFGLISFSMIKILNNFFFARHNTVTPFKVSLVVVIINIAISVTFFKDLGFVIIPIATSISSWIGTIILFIILQKRQYFKLENINYSNIIKVLLATIIMAISLVLLLNFFSLELRYDHSFKVFYLFTIILFVAFLYILVVSYYKLIRLKNFKFN